jgi:signal transduction histidine kinase
MRDLLEYGKPLNLELSPGSIAEVVEQASRITTPENERPVVAIANRVTADLPLVLLDAARLHQVFQNLIANAVYHSPRGGTVTVDAEEVRLGGQRWVDCVVKDEGPGFRAEDLSRIFEPFFTRRRGGTGLGLSIVQRIVEGHSGKILAGNRPEGGAMVIVRLPVLENKLERKRVNPENHAS